MGRIPGQRHLCRRRRHRSTAGKQWAGRRGGGYQRLFNSLFVPELRDSIPSALTVIDADHNGVDDRAYVGDSGGNVWRLDLAEHSQLADLSGKRSYRQLAPAATGSPGWFRYSGPSFSRPDGAEPRSTGRLRRRGLSCRAIGQRRAIPRFATTPTCSGSVDGRRRAGRSGRQPVADRPRSPGEIGAACAGRVNQPVIRENLPTVAAGTARPG